MRRLLPALCAWLMTSLASAQLSEPLPPPTPAAPPAPPARNGYAFDYPRILAQQRLFGIAHGVALLANACRSAPTADADEAAYALWRVAQGPAIAAAQTDLGEYFFGNGATEWQELARKMSLKEALDLPPESDALQAACASLPEALQQSRYALAERFRLEELMARTVEATETEAREGHCRKLFSDELLELHEARFALWQEMNLPLLAEGNKELAAGWPADAPAPSFDAWYAELRNRTQAGGTLADCVAFSESIKRPEAALRNVFRMPPPPPPPSPKSDD